METGGFVGVTTDEPSSGGSTGAGGIGGAVAGRRG